MLAPIDSHISNGLIDWHATASWINHNPYDFPTSEKLSKLQGTKVKHSNFIYLTADNLQRNYPMLTLPYVRSIKTQ